MDAETLDRYVSHAHERMEERGRRAASELRARDRAALLLSLVVADELIPESHSGGNEREATMALLVGFALMLGLDNAFCHAAEEYAAAVAVCADVRPRVRA